MNTFQLHFQLSTIKQEDNMGTKVYFNAESAFENLFKYIMAQGIDRSGTKTVFDVSIKLQLPNENIITTPWRNWSESYAKLEYDWYKTGNPDPTIVAERAKIWKNITDPVTGTVNSNYGAAWLKNDQLAKVKQMLKDDPLTRRAIVLHYDIAEIDNYKLDTPCNISCNFYILNDQLYLTVFARSIDLVFGFCNDQYCFSRLLSDTADDLGIPIGTMTYFITNLHIYERHYYIDERHTKEVPKKSSIRNLKNSQDV
jgi:thymidylate synthase